MGEATLQPHLDCLNGSKMKLLSLYIKRAQVRLYLNVLIVLSFNVLSMIWTGPEQRSKSQEHTTLFLTSGFITPLSHHYVHVLKLSFSLHNRRERLWTAPARRGVGLCSESWGQSISVWLKKTRISMTQRGLRKVIKLWNLWKETQLRYFGTLLGLKGLQRQQFEGKENRNVCLEKAIICNH